MKHLSEDVLIECRKWFWKQDQDRNGKLCWREFNQMVNALGLHLKEEQLNKAFNIADRDHSGQITFAEFIAAYCTEDSVIENFEPVTPEKIKEARDYFNSEKLTRVEFIRMTSETKICMTNDTLAKAFDIADADKDGRISFDQFAAIFCGLKDESGNTSLDRQQSLDSEISGLCKYFWYSDKNADGKLSATEFLKMLDTIGLKLSSQEKQTAFTIADGDGDGMISFKEFADAYLNSDKTKLTAKQLKHLFNKADKDKNGVLSREECLDALKMLGHAAGQRRVGKIVELMDKDCNKNISLEEFFEFLDITDDDLS